MNCRDIESALSAYMDRELPTWEKTRVASHLDTCEACRGELNDLLQVKRYVRSQAMPEIPVSVHQAIEQATVKNTTRWTSHLRVRWWIPTLAFAAALSGWLLTQAADHYFSRTPDLLVAQPKPRTRVDASHDVARFGEESPSRQIQ